MSFSFFMLLLLYYFFYFSVIFCNKCLKCSLCPPPFPWHFLVLGRRLASGKCCLATPAWPHYPEGSHSTRPAHSTALSIQDLCTAWRTHISSPHWLPPAGHRKLPLPITLLGLQIVCHRTVSFVTLIAVSVLQAVPFFSPERDYTRDTCALPSSPSQCHALWGLWPPALICVFSSGSSGVIV